MTKRRHSKSKVDRSPMWDCPTCIAQMVGGVRCLMHNPTPEEREKNPEVYYRQQFAPSAKKVT